MKANVFSLDGKKMHEIELPNVFETVYNPELIKRAVLSIQSARLQPKGIFVMAGRMNTAEYRGARRLPTEQRSINVGRARLPRLKNRRGLLYGRVARVPQAVGGVRAHPPKVEKILLEEINKKEKQKALQSAIAASVKKELVEKRHVLEAEVSLPIIVEDKFENLKKTKEVIAVLKALHLGKDIKEAGKKRRLTKGKARMRGRKHSRKKSVLIVTGKNSGLYKAARNLSGVDVCEARNLNSELFAPGCLPGRLAVWTESAVKKLGEKA